MHKQGIVPIDNPLALLSVSAEDTVSGLFFGLGLIFSGFSSLASIFVRYRRAGSMERTQIMWLHYFRRASFVAKGYCRAT